MLAQAARSNVEVWDPRKKQGADLGTLFGPLDPDAEAARGAPIATSANGGNRADLGGFIVASDSAAPSIVPGKYRKAIDPTAATNGFIWAPMDSLPIKEGTVEALITADANWETLTSQAWTLGSGDTWQFLITGGVLSVTIAHGQNPANLSYTFPASYTLPASTYLAGTTYSVAATLDPATGTLSLILEAVVRATNAGFVPPLVYSQGAQLDGFKLPAGTATATHLTIEGLKISRKKKVPLVKAARLTGRNSIVVSATPSGQNVMRLNGFVKPLTGKTNGPLPAAAALAKAQNALGVVRDAEKVIEATPILAGGTPDATHPDVGHSGLFCYDFQVWKRTLDQAFDDTGVPEFYWGCGGTPQILGGSPTTPYTANTYISAASTQQPDVSGICTMTTTVNGESGSGYFECAITEGGTNTYVYNTRGSLSLQTVALMKGTPGGHVAPGTTVKVGKLSGLAYSATWNQQEPSSFANWATICADFLYYAKVTQGRTGIKYVSLWNEPDGAGFWPSGDVTNYLAMWDAWYAAMKAVDPTIKLGGNESVNFALNKVTWIQALMNHGAANSSYPDYIGYHDYSGANALAVNASLTIASYAAALSRATPEVLVGELGWQSANTGFAPGSGKFPFMMPAASAIANLTAPPTGQQGRTDFADNAYNAAFHAAKMVTYQQINDLGSSYAKHRYATHFSGNDASIFDATATPKALFNVFRLWGMLVGGQVLNITSDDLPPGVRRLAVKIGSQVFVLIVSQHYRRTRPNGSTTHTIPVDVSAHSFANGTNVSVWNTDDLTANAYDAPGTSSMTPTTTTVQGGKVTAKVRMQAVQLLVIG